MTDSISGICRGKFLPSDSLAKINLLSGFRDEGVFIPSRLSGPPDRFASQSTPTLYCPSDGKYRRVHTYRGCRELAGHPYALSWNG